MEDNRFFPRITPVWFFGLLGILLAAGLMVGSVRYQRPADPACYGRLGAGFPVSFICDNEGESPVSSWGKIDSADIHNINPLGYVVDIPFYISLVWIAEGLVWALSRRVYRRIPPR